MVLDQVQAGKLCLSFSFIGGHQHPFHPFITTVIRLPSVRLPSTRVIPDFLDLNDVEYLSQGTVFGAYGNSTSTGRFGFSFRNLQPTALAKTSLSLSPSPSDKQIHLDCHALAEFVMPDQYFFKLPERAIHLTSSLLFSSIMQFLRKPHMSINQIVCSLLKLMQRKSQSDSQNKTCECHSYHLCYLVNLFSGP